MTEQQRHSRFAELLVENQSRIYGYIHSLVRDFDDVDDLFQQTAVILWKKFQDYDATRSFVTWACGIARFEVCNFLRSRSRQKLYFTDDLNLLLIEAYEHFKPDEMEDRREALTQCISKLRDRDRELLQGCYNAHSDVKTVADNQGRSPQSVHNSLRRIRQSLFECIERTLARKIIPEILG